MKFDQNLEPVRVALASYDVRELRVQKRYLEDQDVPLACNCYQRGWALLDELRRHGRYDVVVLSSQLEDMDEGQFIQQMRQLDHKPLLLLSGIKNCHTISSNCLQRDDSYYMIRQMELKHFCREIERLYGGTVPRILEDGCRKLFAAWGLEDQDIRCRYLAAALQIACGSKEHLALRKQLLEQVAQQYQVSVAAVDSGIRRLIDQLEEQCPPAWQRFKRECGLGDGRPTTGKLIYGLRRVLLVHTRPKKSVSQA